MRIVTSKLPRFTPLRLSPASPTSAIVHTPFTRSASVPSCTLGTPVVRHSSSLVGLPLARNSRLRPRLSAATVPFTSPVGASRSLFIRTETTPNQDALKFLPEQRILPPQVPVAYLEYLSPRATIAPPYPSPLAAELMNVEGVQAVFFGADFITVTKDPESQWAHIRPEVFSIITQALTSGEPLVTLSDRDADGADGQQAAGEEDSLAYNENDSEVVGMIKELLETRIRPAIQEDGGDIEFRGFVDGYVNLRLRGACRTCDSSTVTLKNGIEGMLMHYIEEVKGVHQVLDPEEEIALQEFVKFEEKLKEQKPAST